MMAASAEAMLVELVVMARTLTRLRVPTT